MFLWKLIENALPMTDDLALLCLTEEETLVHLFISCNFAREVRFVSVFSLRN